MKTGITNKRRRRMRRIGLPVLFLLGMAVLLAACGSAADEAQTSGQKEAASGTSGSTTAASATPAAAAEDAAQPTAAAAEVTPAYPLQVTDELGHEVMIPAKPARIFAPSMEDSLVALGIKPVLQWSNGVQPQQYLQASLSDVPQVSFASGAPSMEAVLAAKPDLILLHNAYYGENGLYEQYAKIAPTYVFQNASDDWNRSLQTLGQLLGETGKAEQAAKSYADKAQAAKAKLAGLLQGKEAAIIRFNAKGMFFLNGERYSGYVLAHDLGLAESSLVAGGAFEVSLEALPELDADYVFLVNDGHQGDAYLNQLQESKIWQSMPAVQQGRVYTTNSDYWLSGGLIAQSKVIDDVQGFLQP